MIFRFIAAKKAEHSIAIMCRVLGVSRSGFHAWQGRKPSARALEDRRLTVRIAAIHQDNRRVYGSPRIHAELVLGDGERLGRKRVARLMRAAGISGLVARKRGRTTIRVPGVRVCDDLVDRAFAAEGPNRIWVADITYLRSWEGWLYLAAVQDLYSRRIVGWSMADHMRAELVVDALQMGLEHRQSNTYEVRYQDIEHHRFPNRVGVPNAMPSAHSRSSSVAVGSLRTTARWRPQCWFCEISISEAISSTWRNRTNAPAASAPSATACANACTFPVAL